MLNRLLRKRTPVRPIDSAAIPEGRRVYAIGDVHGRNDLLQQLLDKIIKDDGQRGKADSEIIFLGDLVDRGPDSAGVIMRKSIWQRRRAMKNRCDFSIASAAAKRS